MKEDDLEMDMIFANPNVSVKEFGRQPTKQDIEELFGEKAS